VPPARNGQSLESGDSDDESNDRELSGEVRSILSSSGNVRQGVRSKAVRADVTVHGNPDEPVDLYGDTHPESRQKRVKSCARVQLVTIICHDEQGLVPRRQETSPIRRRHVREGHAPTRIQPNCELPHSHREPVITSNGQRVPKDDSRRGERRTYRSDDERQIQLRGRSAAAGAGDPGDPGDHRDRGERDDRGCYKRQAMGDITQAEHGARNRDRSWSSRRRDSDDGDSSAFRPVSRGDDPPVRRP